MTATEVARALGVNERTIRRAIKSGRLTARKVHARRYDVDPEEARIAIRLPADRRVLDALELALETLREVGYTADADEIALLAFGAEHGGRP